MPTAIPDQGQLAEVGQRHFVVLEVAMSGLLPHDIRFTVSEPARCEILDRLLALNHHRRKEEVEQGLHNRAAAKTKTGKTKTKRRKTDTNQKELF